jgi:hypothetical protein
MCDLAPATADYRYLRERGYSPQAALKLVGDRYELTARERNLLFRGVLPAAVARARAAKLIAPDDVAGARLGVDWYNVLITVESYLKGSAVFLAEDGVVRDAAAVHGSYRAGIVTDRAAALLVEALRSLAPAAVDVFIDSPVAYSGQMAAGLRERLRGAAFAANVEVVESPDHFLKSYPGVVASSDSAIIDPAARVLDFARYALRAAYGFEPPEVSALRRAPG